MLRGAATEDSQSDGCVGSRPMALSLCRPNTTWPSWITQNSSRGVKVSSLRSGSGGNTIEGVQAKQHTVHSAVEQAERLRTSAQCKSLVLCKEAQWCGCGAEVLGVAS